MKIITKLSVFLCMMIVLLTSVMANNVQITRAVIAEQNKDTGVSAIEFDVNWENSWRTSNLNDHGVENWDAVWVFAKYRHREDFGGDGLWKHVWLNETGHVSPQGAVLEVGLVDHRSPYDPADNPGVGAFVYRDAEGSGDFSAEGVTLSWNHAANGLTGSENLDLQVFAIEMVYITSGSFYLGSGGSEASRFKDGGSNNPFLLASEGALTMGSGDGELWAAGWTSGNVIPADFPKGYAAFYCMKYSVSQQQYVDFLNTLTYAQQEKRTLTSPSSPGYITGEDDIYARNAIIVEQAGAEGDLPATYSTANPYVPASYLSWADGLAYSDWAGLRVMSELEYEKASRGFADPVPNEYAWGTAEAHPNDNRYDLENFGDIDEAVTNPTESNSIGNVWTFDTRLPGMYGGGPARVGIFADEHTNRVEAGASYFGVMDLSGQVIEQVVYPIRNAPRAYTGLHGDGYLDDNGDANVPFWFDTDGTFDNRGAGRRGGSHNFNTPLTRVSRRDGNNDWLTNAARNRNTGFRAVRSTFAAAGIPENMPLGSYALTNDIEVIVEGSIIRIGQNSPSLITADGENQWIVPELNVSFFGVEIDDIMHLQFERYEESMVLPPAGNGPAYDYSSMEADEIINHLTPRLMAAYNVPGVSIARTFYGNDAHNISNFSFGLKVYDEFDKVNAETVFEAASMSKPVFAYLIMQLVEEGTVDLDMPLVDYYGGPYELMHEDYIEMHNMITPRMILNHSSGLPNWRSNASWNYTTGISGGDPLTLAFTPGTQERYSGEGMLFMQTVVESLADQELNGLINNNLLNPAEMDNSTFLRNYAGDQSAAGHTSEGVNKNKSSWDPANAAYSMYTTAEDYAMFLLEMINEDRTAKHTINDELLETMLTSEIIVPGASQILRNSDETDAEVWRALGWRVDRLQSGDRFYHSGSNFTGFRSFAEFNPETKNGIVILTNGDNGRNVWREIMKLVGEP